MTIDEITDAIIKDIEATATPVSRPMFSYVHGYRIQDIAYRIRRTLKRIEEEEGKTCVK